MGELIQTESTQVVPSKINGVDAHLWKALKEALYPGAADASVVMVLDYCKARKLDPMQKPVHIVPMYDSKTKGYKDTIMPGIGLYRTIAARTNKHCGTSEPEYGKTIATNMGGVQISYPESCKVTVKKLMQGTLVDFTVKALWLENYAVKERNSIAPNKMWQKRPFAQLAKCAESLALRQAFPEDIPAIPTFEEMEGKNIITNEDKPATKDPLSAFLDKENKIEDSKIIKQTEDDLLVVNDMEYLKQLIKQHNISELTVKKWCDNHNVPSIEELPLKKIQPCIDYIKEKHAKKEKHAN